MPSAATDRFPFTFRSPTGARAPDALFFAFFFAGDGVDGPAPALGAKTSEAVLFLGSRPSRASPPLGIDLGALLATFTAFVTLGRV